jgi:hypothetical protein
VTEPPVAGEDEARGDDLDYLARRAGQLEDGSLDADELDDEPDWWDEGSDDEQ